MRADACEHDEAHLASVCRYLEAIRVRVSRAENWVVLNPMDRQICETAVLVRVKEKSEGVAGK